MLDINDKAPGLLGRDESGREVSLADFKGKKLVLYFYPKDMTQGCTAEACNLRDNYDELRARGYEVLWASALTTRRSTRRFIEKNGLPFHLIADTEKRLVEQFGVWGREEDVRAHLHGHAAHHLHHRRRRRNRARHNAQGNQGVKDHAAQILKQANE